MLRLFSSSKTDHTTKKQRDENKASPQTQNSNNNYVNLHDDIFSNTELYTDHDHPEDEEDAQEVVLLLGQQQRSDRSIQSHRSQKSWLRRRGQRQKKHKKQQSLPDKDLDDILQSFAKNRSPSRQTVIVPTTEDHDDHSSYHSGLSSAMSGSFVSAAQSQKSQSSSRGLRKLWPRKAAHPTNSQQQGGGDVAIAVAAAALQSKQKHKKAQAMRAKKRSDAGSVRSNVSRSWSVSSLSVRHFMKRRKQRKQQQTETHSTKEKRSTSASIPTEVGVARSVKSDQAVRRSHPKKLLGRNKKQHSPRNSTTVQKRYQQGMDRVVSSSQSTGKLSQKQQQQQQQQHRNNNKGLKTKKPPPPPQRRMDLSDAISASSTIESSLADALKASASLQQHSLPDFEPRFKQQQKNHTTTTRTTKPPRIMIDPMDIEVFLKRDMSKDNGDNDSDDGDDVSTLSSGTSLSMSSSPNSVMDLRRSDDYGVYNKPRSTSLSATGRGTNHDTRITSLLHGDLTDLAPPDTTTSAYLPASMAVDSNQKTISLLLIHMGLKIFEIVEVVVSRGTTVGDAIDKATRAAVDATLAKQTYSSLCSDVKEFFLNAPVSKMAPWQDASPKLFASEEEMKREMERILLVAVPQTSNSADCRKIRRMLWKNPKLQVWWKATKQTTKRSLRTELRTSRSVQ